MAQEYKKVEWLGPNGVVGWIQYTDGTASRFVEVQDDGSEIEMLTTSPNGSVTVHDPGAISEFLEYAFEEYKAVRKWCIEERFSDNIFQNATIEDPKPKYPQVEVELVGKDGNAFAILGRCQKAVRRAGLPKEVFDQYKAEATSGDYDHLLQTTMEWFNAE